MKRLLLFLVSNIPFMYITDLYSMHTIVHKIQARIDPQKVIRERQKYTQKLLNLVQKLYCKSYEERAPTTIKKYLAYGAHIEAYDDDKYWTPLFWAIYHENKAIVDLLLQAGANVCVRDKLQRTPLHIAVKAGHMYFINALIAHGANIYAISDQGEVPFDLVLKCPDTAFIRYFRKLHNLKMREIWLKILQKTVLEKFAVRIVASAYPI